MKKVLLLTCLVLLGCDGNKLSDIEKAAEQAFTCKVHQIMPNECSKFDKALEISELKATQAGIEQKRIFASRQIGEKVVLGDIGNSPYQRVKRSLESEPFYIDALEDNFISYRVSCLNLEFDKLTKTMERIDRRKKQYHTVAYFQKGKVLNVFFVKENSPCRPDSYSDIQEEFPIITEEQLAKFKSGVYLKSASFPRYSSVNAIIFDTFEEAKEKFQDLMGNEDK